MKKGIRDNNPVLALWQRVILDGRIYKLARECRKKIGIPENGFNSFDEFDIWIKKIDSKIESETTLFIEKSKKIIPYEGIITDNSFRYLMMEFLIYDKIKDGHFSSLNNSGMGVKIIKDSKIFYPKLKEYIGEIEDGVYVKIKPFSTIDGILKYIENNKDLIRNSLKDYAESAKLTKPKRIKASSHFQRDFMILMVDDEYSKKEIEENYNIKADYKDMAIARLISIKVEKGVTSSIVKAVKQRRKIK